MTNFGMMRLFFRKGIDGYVCLPEDMIEFDDSHKIPTAHGFSIDRYAVSTNVLYYDNTYRQFKQHLPELFWNTINISQPPTGSLNCFWIIRDKKMYDTSDVYKRMKKANKHENYNYLWKLMGKDHKYIYRVAIWFQHFFGMNMTSRNRYKKHVREKIADRVNDVYVDVIDRSIHKLHKRNRDLIKSQI